LKDDKSYPIQGTLGGTLSKGNCHPPDGDGWIPVFWPIHQCLAVHQTLDVLRRIFPYLTCDRNITGQDERACLYYDIKLCTAPCIGAINQAGYRQMIDDLCQFLDGRTEPIVSRLLEEMRKAAEELHYETRRRLARPSSGYPKGG